MTVALEPLLCRFLEAARVAERWRVVGPLERKLRVAMERAFREQGKAFLAGFSRLRGLFREALTAEDWLLVYDAATRETFDLFLSPLQTAVEASLMAGARAVIADLGVDVAFNLRNPRAVSYMEAHGAELVSGINDTTKDYLRTLLAQATDEGWSYARTAKAITDRYSEFAVGVPQQHLRSRAELIAVQETASAYENGSALVIRDLQDAGLKMEKSWLTVGDNLVSQEICAPNEAQGWIPLDEPFQSGDDHAPGHISCRCTTLYRRSPG